MAKRWNDTMRGFLYLDTYVHLHGNREVRVENCTKILEYNEVLVRVRTRDILLEIWGSGLRVFDFNDGSVVVRGSISSVLLSETK